MSLIVYTTDGGQHVFDDDSDTYVRDGVLQIATGRYDPIVNFALANVIKWGKE